LHLEPAARSPLAQELRTGRPGAISTVRSPKHSGPFRPPPDDAAERRTRLPPCRPLALTPRRAGASRPLFAEARMVACAAPIRCNPPRTGARPESSRAVRASTRPARLPQEPDHRPVL